MTHIEKFAPLKHDIGGRIYKFFKGKIQNLYVPTTEDKSQNIYRYGQDNLLPNKIIKYINDSGISKKCAVKVSTYVSGDGWADESSAQLKVNSRQTANDLLRDVANDVSYFKGFALKIGRRLDGSIAFVEHMPFQIVRKTLRGDYLINPTYGLEGFKKDEGKYYPAFNGIKITPAQIAKNKKEYENRPEILYVYESTPDNPHYPVPDFYSGIEDLRTSSRIQQYDLNMVMNGFKAAAILTLIGVSDDKTKDDTGRTQRDYLFEELEQFTGMNPNSNGETSEGGIFVFEAKTKDEVPSLQTFDVKAILDASNTKRETIDRAVCRLFGVHPVLVGFSDAQVLGNTQSIANASLELGVNVKPLQRMIEQAFKTLYPDNSWDISEFMPINYVPESVYSKLTDNEIRELYGYAPLESNNTDEKLLVERLGVGGTQAFTTILADAVMTPEQKRATLKILFGLDEEKVNELLPISEPTNVLP